jgi:PHD/YefM family antitoxin component YafN of YafNO toxin-antitoxin module
MRNIAEREVLISTTDLDAAHETAALLSDPDAVTEIHESEADVAAGRVTEAEDLRAAMIARHSAGT